MNGIDGSLGTASSLLDSRAMSAGAKSADPASSDREHGLPGDFDGHLAGLSLTGGKLGDVAAVAKFLPAETRRQPPGRACSWRQEPPRQTGKGELAQQRLPWTFILRPQSRRRVFCWTHKPPIRTAQEDRGQKRSNRMLVRRAQLYRLARLCLEQRTCAMGWRVLMGWPVKRPIRRRHA